eukprot:CAMPEP_0195600488 /NCGR_PEP_ID=MMETSP0815-20121206/4580_1 /TAXON_ID=97485 /ORGANISM="Prymnesium parvum, Strain Texoma1" /LENGTH=84 /DNA_ID=CAMNT_0040739969 /DNA_START=483 /DNA_END=737 /DNA_ORIENTATION=+
MSRCPPHVGVRVVLGLRPSFIKSTWSNAAASRAINGRGSARNTTSASMATIEYPASTTDVKALSFDATTCLYMSVPQYAAPVGV